MESKTKDRAVLVALIGAAGAIITPIAAGWFGPDAPRQAAAPEQSVTPGETPTPAPAPTQVAPQPASIPSRVPPDWSDTLGPISTGVTSISVTRCDDSSAPAGSGFLVSETHIATAAHVVTGAASLTVGPGGTVSEAEVIGYSEEADLALLRIDEPVAGHVFTWAEEPLRVGQEVSALGYPLDVGFSSTQGSISSLHPRVDGFSDTVRYVQTDAPTNPGNSGGPLVTIDGTVAGVVFSGFEYTVDGRPVEGMNYALSHEDAQPLIDAWIASPQPPEPVQCPVAPDVPETVTDVSVDVTVATEHEDAPALAQTLSVHGTAINDSQYDVAFNLFTSSLQERMGGVGTWREGLLTTYWRELAVVDVTGSGDTRTARTLVRTEQAAADGPGGQTCSIWYLDYAMVNSAQAGRWLIDGVSMPEDPQAC